MFKRKIYDKLVEWKRETEGRTALLIEGARRIGKSTIVRQFAEKEYASFILIDRQTLAICTKMAWHKCLRQMGMNFSITHLQTA